jgi:hypothetical protein
MTPIPNLDEMNLTELLQILSSRGYGSFRLKRSTPRDRLIHLIQSGEIPSPDELAGSTETRKALAAWISKYRVSIETQLPCKGVNRGICTIFPCPEGKHLDCYLGARDKINV